MARRHSAELVDELSRIALGRKTLDSQLVEFTEAVQGLTVALRRKKMDGHNAVEELTSLMDKLTKPPSDSDIIKASDILLNRGWGRPTTETLDYQEFLGMDTDKARETVQAALVARAIQGDVSAQQAFLRLPTQIEIGILGDEELDASQLSEDELSLFLSLIEKMKPGQSGPEILEQ